MASRVNHHDVLVIGGGVIGLSLAWELSLHNVKVCVVDRSQFGQEASWAGAGMIPPGSQPAFRMSANTVEQLEGLSQLLHQAWHQQLRELTGIDNGYRQCGGLYLATNDIEANTLHEGMRRWKNLGVEAYTIDATEVSDLEPALADWPVAACVVPDEAQIRNPWHLKALLAACRLSGVDLRPDVEVCRFQTTTAGITAVETSGGLIHAEQFCLSAGCWTGKLAASIGLELPVRPIRGQIVLIAGAPGLLRRNVCVGQRYLVSRSDGLILIGSTEESVGFENRNTEEAVAELTAFATSLVPEIGKFSIEKCWSGLRPATSDGLPYLGRVPHLSNAWLSTGHFRAGLQLSPATAVVMRSLLLGEVPPLDVKPLGIER